MRLSDLMSQMHLTFYPEVGLVMFLGIFAAVVVHVVRGSRGAGWEDVSRLPLTEDERRGGQP
ncbi:MAG TPA: hypothetical protein VFH51_00450 [Myxococcota bacterium]|nr:hypothetical protein [Myxococcota bacterium]